MFKFPDWCYTKLPNSSRFWIFAWFVWFATLWYLSSTNHAPKDGPNIPHLDKVVHFCYFMAGGFCFANFLQLNTAFPWKKVIIATLVIGSAVGMLDEYHQSTTLGRNGNDFGDWLADTLGSLAGALYCYYMWKRLKPASPTV